MTKTAMQFMGINHDQPQWTAARILRQLLNRLARSRMRHKEQKKPYNLSTPTARQLLLEVNVEYGWSTAGPQYTCSESRT